MRLQRAGKVWATIKKRFLKCKLSKITQAKVFEACVESKMLFNVAVGPFLAREIKSFKSFVERSTGIFAVIGKANHRDKCKNVELIWLT